MQVNVLSMEVTPHLDKWTNISTPNTGGSSVIDYFTCDYSGIDYFEELIVIPCVNFLEKITWWLVQTTPILVGFAISMAKLNLSKCFSNVDVTNSYLNTQSVPTEQQLIKEGSKKFRIRNLTRIFRAKILCKMLLQWLLNKGR